MKTLCTAIVLALVGATAPAHAKVDEQLANQCHTLALKAHPARLPDIPAVTNLRQSYYNLCIGRHGNMDPELPNPKSGE
jgi:hypothetical protein